MLKEYSGYKLNNQTVLQEVTDENYEPTQEEIHEYAIYIGIDPEKELDLIWLAREGLMKPLPSGWKPCQEENGELYYFNFDTGKSLWDHPCDEIYKVRVMREREKKTSSVVIDTSSNKGKNTSSISDLSSGKKSHILPVYTKNETIDNQCDSQYTNSDSNDELNNSDNDHVHNSNDFQKDDYIATDRQVSARDEYEENDARIIITPAVPMSYINNTEKKVDNSKNNHERIKRASLAAQAAEYRKDTNKTSINTNTSITRHDDVDIDKLRKSLEQSLIDEKLQLLEENRSSIEKLKTELHLAKEQEERALRNKMKTDLTLIENNIRENLLCEKKSLESRQQNDLNKIKEATEREKQELQKKLRTDMLSDLNLEQQNNTNIEMRLLQMKHKFEEKLRNVENQYKNEIEDLTRRYEQIKVQKDSLEKSLKEKNDFCSTLQRTTNQLRSDKSSLERKLQDAQAELKSIDDSNRQISSSIIQKSSSNQIDDDNSNFEQTLSNNKYILRDDDNNNNNDEEGLSDTDSDVIQMKQTLNEFKHISSLSKTNISMNNFHEKKHSKPTTVDLNESYNNDASLIPRNIPFERASNPSLTDSGQWGNTILSTMSNNTYPLGMQSLHHYQTSRPKTNYWQSQPSLITREAVIKAARDVLPPGVFDRLSSKN